jgi:hypothetical protein
MKKLFLILTLVFATFPAVTKSYGECTDYGFGSYYDYLSGGCKCMSGYVWGEDIFGGDTCVSGNQSCHDDYGYNSRYNSLTGSCECNYGYAFSNTVFGKQCVSLNSICTDQLGYNSRYNSLTDSCQCNSGYIIDGGMCVNANSYCSSEHGLYSSYQSYSKSCTCDSGYTMDENSQCVKKQNNVYFDLKELDTDNNEAIIRSDYDYSNYRIKYFGCFDSTIRRYEGDQIVVNLGTDFDVDTGDYIVLQDDDETCEITRVRYVSSSETLFEEEYYYPITNIPKVNKPAVTPTPNSYIAAQPKNDPVVNNSNQSSESKIEEPTFQSEPKEEKSEPKVVKKEQYSVRKSEKAENKIEYVNPVEKVTKWIKKFVFKLDWSYKK